jgi:hypothetical protein
VLPRGTPEARFGLSVGLIVGGMATMAVGLGDEFLDGAATSTGIGAAAGVPAMGLPSIPLLKRGERFPGRLHTYIEPMVRTKN